MARFIRAILFDLGGTLMYARGAWEPVRERAGRALTDALRAQDLPIDLDRFAEQFRKRLREYYEQRDSDYFETTYLSVLREMLVDEGHANITEAGLRSALDAMFEVTQTNWALEDDAVSTLKSLESSGYRMGIISNAGDSKDVFQLVERFGIEPYFDFILTSAACSYRKPHPRIFELALAHWNIPASEAAMIGDALTADVFGAQNAGMCGIWISRRAVVRADELHRIKPDARLLSLNELPAVLGKLA